MVPKQKLLTLLFICFFSVVTHAQDTDFQATNTTNTDVKVNKKKEGPKRKKLIKVLKDDTQGILYGNKCFEDMTAEMGFEYVVQPEGQPGSLTGFNKFTHNLWSKIKIMFKNGPWWKAKVNKRMKECREMSGDYMG